MFTPEVFLPRWDGTDRIYLLRCTLASCGTVYCYRSCLWVTGGVCGGQMGGVSYHDNSIYTKLGL